MRISAKTEYACIAMLELALQYGTKEPVQIRKIAERHEVPARFLVQILLQLKAAGLVTSVRGAAGGYQLAPPPDKVSLGAIMDAIDGLLDDGGKQSSASPDSSAAKILAQTWKEVAAVERKMLEGITLADLLERSAQQGGQMYHI
ncbi:MAG: Rrf2 family transcriptional regulator [Planctomycetaceae bacterium]|nr:Rrf2 family transcriptional regulator [Planctomycetaceae bacterium]